MSGSPVDHLTTSPATPPATPPAESLPLPSIAAASGTPHNRGSASRSHRDDTSGMKGPPPRVTKDYEEYLLEDLKKHRVYISFENGLRNILHVPSDWKSSGHEYQRIISKVHGDKEYKDLQTAYFEICDKTGAIEPTLYKPQAKLYNKAISLINKYCDEDYRKDENLLLHFRVNHPKPIAQGIFHPPGLVPDITGIFKPLENRKSFVWPMIVHVEEMKDSDVALDTGKDAPRAIMKGEEDPLSEHHYPSRKPVKDTDASTSTTTGMKRKNNSDVSGSNKVSRTTQQSAPSVRQDSESTISPPDSQKTAGARIQCARYLMEMLELSILRSHAFVTLVDRDNLQLMYADRSAIVTTSIVDLRTPDGEAMFLAMLIAFHRLTPKQWGFLPLVDNSFTNEVSGDTAYHRHDDSVTQKRDCLKKLKLSLQKGKHNLSLRLQEILYHQPGIIGRGTCVVEASCDDFEAWKKHQKLVVKVSWPSISRQSENALLEQARRKGAELVEMRKAERAKLEAEVGRLRNIGKTAEATQTSEIAEAVVEESGQHWALNHLPNILHSQDFYFDSETEPMPQKTLALFFGKAQIINGTFDYEDRALRVSVQEKLYKVTTLSSLPQYAQVFYDVFLCHRWLHEHPRILHRDISSGNIMYRILDNKVYGVLNDLDLSSLREDVENGNRTSLQRTGTPPYMAIELLQDARSGTPPIRHLYRHDVESLAYNLLLLCCCNEFDSTTGLIRRLPKSPFDQWFNPNLSWDSLADKKHKYLFAPLQLATDVHSTFRAFVPWLEILFSAFHEGFDAKSRWERQVVRYNASLREPPAGLARHAPSNILLHRKFRAEELALNHEITKPPPFDVDTLGGHVQHKSFVLSLMMFNGTELEYRDKDDFFST